MEPVLQSITVGIPVFLTHFMTAIAVLAGAMCIYIWITPHREFALIKENNVAAAISLFAAFVGLSLPLSFCLAGSVNIYDIALWGGFILLIQLITYRAVDLLLGGISRSIADNKVAPVLLMAAAKLSIAMLNAAAIAG